ncbi:hypothetical protein PR048_009304, partial [Dryococelus australis]
MKATAKRIICNLFEDVSVKKLRRLHSYILQDKTPKDMTGIGNTNRALPSKDVLLLNERISSIPVSVTHYSSRQYRFLPPELICQKMYDMFGTKYPNSPITYKYYVNYFNTNFDLSFGLPQIDTYVKCKELMVRLRSPSLYVVAKRVAEAELQMHKLRIFPCLKYPPNILFYMRQLWVNIFAVHNMKTNASVLYTYYEGIAQKCANE